MRVVVVNHSHPSMPHVSGMRAWRFAGELAARGHQVVLLCEWREGAATAPRAADLAPVLGDHDWRNPLILAVKPDPTPLLDRVRDPRTGSLIRKWLVVRSYLKNSGMFTDFTRGAEPYIAALARAFKPHVTWGIFGNTDCWLMAQRLARLSGGSWVADMKDAWDWWIPAGLRRLLATRFSDMAASTANAQFHAASLARWFPTQPQVVYSGVDNEWIETSSEAKSGRSGDEAFRVVLIGGLYDDRTFRRWVDGFRAWVQSVPLADRHRISFCYAGSDSVRVTRAVDQLSREVRVDVRGYVPLPELSALCRSAAINAYLWSPTTFHHKVIELLCCRRPIVSFPGERDESLALAQNTGGSLTACRTESDLRAAFDAIWKGERQPTTTPAMLQHLTWTRQADTLESVIKSATQEATA
jgi:hypothetical protein